MEEQTRKNHVVNSSCSKLPLGGAKQIGIWRIKVDARRFNSQLQVVIRTNETDAKKKSSKQQLVSASQENQRLYGGRNM